MLSNNHTANNMRHGPKEIRHRKWLGQVTENAIENALNLQGEWGRLALIEETQSCGIARARRSNSLIFPLPSISHGQENSASSSRSKTWTLARDSEDRRQVAARIDALLVQWVSEVSVERRATVSVAVNILEEALYQEAKSKDEYTNSLLLDLRLRRVLCHFEAGNGIFLLQGSSPLYPVRTYHDTLPIDPSSSDSLPDITPPASNGPNILAQMAADSKEGSDNESLDWERASLPLKGTVRSLMTAEIRASRRKQANWALLDAAGSGHKRLMEQSLHKHGQYASKKIVKRVINLISRKKREESKRLKLGPTKPIPQLIPENASENAKPERLATEVRRRRSGKSLGDMLKFGNRRSEKSLQLLVAEGPASTSLQALELEEATLANHCRFQIKNIEMQGEGSSSSSSSRCEQHAIPESIVSRPFSDDEPVQDGRGEGSARSLMKSLVGESKVTDELGSAKEQRDSTVASGRSLQSLEKVAATCTDMVAAGEHNDCKKNLNELASNNHCNGQSCCVRRA